MKLLFEEDNKKLFFSLKEEKLLVEIEEEDLTLSINLNEESMAKLIDALKLIIYESEL